MLNYPPKHTWWPGLVGAALLSGSAALAQQPVGQWDFESGNLNATFGSALIDKAGSGTAFGTTTSFGIPDIGGQPAKVMKFPASADSAGGYHADFTAPANGGGALVNDWTMVMDVLFPAASSGKLRALVETDLGSLGDTDADVFVRADNKVGSKQVGFGNVTADTWHRLAIVVAVTSPPDTAGQVRLYVDGAPVGTIGVANLVDQKYALNQAIEFFTDDSGDTQLGYVNSIQLRDEALSKGQLAALGGPTAAGIPAVLPPVPSFVESWIPAGEFASRDTAVGAVIDVGSTTIQDASISLTLDGQVLPNPDIVRSGQFITVRKQPSSLFVPGTDHTVIVSYTDSLAGAKSVTNKFNAALFVENFDGVALGPPVDEAGLPNPEDNLEVWTKTPPTGWSVDNTQFPATIISPENPDDDGDGYPDLDGRTEWAGWSFAKKEFWLTADTQRREEFDLAKGVVAIADPDEWDDQAHFKSLFNSLLKTPPISLAGISANSAFLRFDSSWRPEAFDDVSAFDATTGFPGDYTDPENPKATNNQTALITVSFDGGAPIQVLKWDSADGSPTRHPDVPNESVLVALNNPAGANSMVVTFGMLKGANDWWWAVDNIAISAGASPPIIAQQPVGIEVNEGAKAELTVTSNSEGLTYQWFKGFGTGKTPVAGATAAKLTFDPVKVEDAGYYSVELTNGAGKATSDSAKVAVIPRTEGRLTLLTENFSGVTLGPNQDETTVDETAFTHTPPDGWLADNSGVPGAGTDNDGVTEWAGWSFADKTFWAQAGGQNRSAFTRGAGTVVIGDSDEWDDQAHEPGQMATYLKTKTISLAGVKPGSVIVQFDSSWNPEEPQKANVTVSFDGGAAAEVLRFESAPSSASFHPAELSETVAFRVQNPAGAQNMTLTFGYFETLNNWWWAFDNLVVLADSLAVPPTITLVPKSDGSFDLEYTGTLESSATLNGNFQPVPGAASPFNVKPSAGPASQLYRAAN
ncbi:MAG TPA: hypothetical protein DCE44_03760 [Verrucomicrobiales bacterium]|nr:hypothetical protein [Verrucomicrobiales bacterium]